ncbi:uncharacterized protein BDZ99DRAFT_465235 [Mytilinidion resinicola]|uniref:DUF7728 domain-containing protein n=1 Tax=Mytilinidion resinicola TaxID=574789 RepID=A0A6A6YH34_9PEZI|nr:uncharacterized protein BDZ99DRAFT_465235 [Mytilinidion resinicola]KAF2807325.1 hypothetical protein BDZ99DRAFT_465235 [Mytilinidion resinicola]
MRFPSSGLGAALALAATASAIIIPPNLGIESIGDDNSIETLGVDAYKQAVTVECPGCPVASGEKTLKWTQDVGTSYLIDFEIGQDMATLDISGAQLYPPSFSHFSEPFTVTQVDAGSDKPLRLRVTGYSFHYNTAETISEAGTELLPMTFRITSVETHSVSPPALTIFLLKDNAGRLMIASIQPAPAAIEGSPKEQTKECSKEWPLVCKWKSIVADKFEAIKTKLSKGCHKSKRPGAHGKHAHRPGRPHHRPHHSENQDGHRPHRHHHHHSKALARARWLLFTIVFPIIVGIFAGALTYIIGMVIGSAIALIWAKIRGVRAGNYESVAQNDEEAVDPKGSDKEVYSDLPDYEGEAPPVYEEASEKEVVTDEN